MNPDAAPVLALDGPSGSGKGAVGCAVAERLGWHYLDSGALYRALAWRVQQQQAVQASPAVWGALARALAPRFEPIAGAAPRLWVDGADISAAIRLAPCSELASQLAVHPEVREGLLSAQRALQRAPGLVADGRDMGTVVFPQARWKIFLTAAAEVRAKRRYNQLKQQGISADLGELTRALEARDRRDEERLHAPLKPAVDAFLLDTSTLSLTEVIECILRRLQYGLQ